MDGRGEADTPGPAPPSPSSVSLCEGVGFSHTVSGVQMSSLSPVAKGRLPPRSQAEKCIAAQRGRVLDLEPHREAHGLLTPAPPRTPTACLPAGRCLAFVSPCTVPAGSTWSPVAGLVEGLILETECSRLPELSHPNSRGSKVTFQGGSLGF